LQGYRLVIWDDLGTITDGLNAHDVTTLENAYASGIPLYLIGDHLASVTVDLPEPQRSEWIGLTHLTPGSTTSVGGLVQVQSTVDYNPIINGRFFEVGDFEYPGPLDRANVAGSDAGVLGTSSGSDLLLSYPNLEAVDSGEVRTFTQNVRLLANDSSRSADARKGLFQNVVCWLLNCPTCSDVDVRVELAGPGDPVPAGAPFDYIMEVAHSGECEATGTVVTEILPAEFNFVGADSAHGTWSYDPGLNTVTFVLGHLAKASVTELKVTVLPLQEGTFTSHVVARMNGPEVTLDNNAAEALTIVKGGTTSAAPPRLEIGFVHGTYELHLSGQAGVNYEIQMAPDLKIWSPLTNVYGADWRATLNPSASSSKSAQFYRAQLAR
jgi:hypothetical protein